MGNIFLKTRKKGFTIIEVIVVCMILVILVGLVSTVLFELQTMTVSAQEGTKGANATLTFLNAVSDLSRGCKYAECTADAIIFYYEDSQYALEYDLYDVTPSVAVNNIDKYIQIEFGGREYCVNFVPT